MALNYYFKIKDGMFVYNCITYSSYIKIMCKDIEKIYEILNQLNTIYEQALTAGVHNIDYSGFTIVFNFNGSISIKNISNWLGIKEEVPIIKRELSKYIKKRNMKSVKDIIVKIKSLKRGSSNRIKEDLK